MGFFHRHVKPTANTQGPWQSGFLGIDGGREFFGHLIIGVASGYLYSTV